jgi:hypothetical protein
MVLTWLVPSATAGGAEIFDDNGLDDDVQVDQVVMDLASQKIIDAVEK